MSNIPGVPAAPASHLKEAALGEYLDRLQRLGRPTSPAAWEIWCDVALSHLRLKYHNVSPQTDQALYNELSGSAVLGQFKQHLAEGTEFPQEAEGLNKVLEWARELLT